MDCLNQLIYPIAEQNMAKDHPFSLPIKINSLYLAAICRLLYCTSAQQVHEAIRPPDAPHNHLNCANGWD